MPRDFFSKVPSVAVKLFLPRMHAVLSGISNTFSENSNIISYYARVILGAVDGLVTPTLKFRFTNNELARHIQSGRIENDPDYNGLAFRTPQAIGFWHLGISGSFSHLIKDPKGVIEGICDAPASAIAGLALIAAGLYVAKKTYEYSKKDASAEPNHSTSSKIIRIGVPLLCLVLSAF